MSNEDTLKDPLLEKNLHQSSLLYATVKQPSIQSQLESETVRIDGDYQTVAKNYLQSVSSWSKMQNTQKSLEESESDTEIKTKKRKRSENNNNADQLQSSSAPVRKYKRKTNKPSRIRATDVQIETLQETDLINQQSNVEQSILRKEIDADVTTKVAKLQKSSKRTQNKNPEKAAEIEQQILIAQDRSKPLSEQQLYYPINNKLLEEQAKILNILSLSSNSKNIGNKEEFVRIYDSAVMRDMDNSFVMKFVRQYQPESFLHQSRDFYSPVGNQQLVIEKRLRDDENEFLRQPKPGVDRPCRNGKYCQGTRVPDSIPIVLTEYLTKTERQILATTGKLPDEPRRCVMCNRNDIQFDHMSIRSTADDIKGQFCIQNYCNVVNVEGEYDMRQCFMSSSSDYQGIPKPVVIHCLYWYKQYTRADGLLAYDQSGYIKYSAHDKFWTETMNEPLQDFLKGLAT